jgi:hypothetical protein
MKQSKKKSVVAQAFEKAIVARPMLGAFGHMAIKRAIVHFRRICCFCKRGLSVCNLIIA